MQEVRNTKKFRLFMDWLDVNRPELNWATGDTIARVMKNNPSASFKSLAKMLAKIAEEAEVIAEESLGEFDVEDIVLEVEPEVIPSEPEVEVEEVIVLEVEATTIAEEVTMQNNNVPEITPEEEAAVKEFMASFEKQIRDTHIPSGKVDSAITQLAHKQANFARKHPKTTVALTAAGVGLASYGAYRLAKEFLL